MHLDLFKYSPIIDRSPLEWPHGARVAFYVGLNVEQFHIDRPSTSMVEATSNLVPDALNFGWRDYGPRVGIWRILDALDRHDIRASALLNSEVIQHHPRIIEAGLERNWAWIAHGETNSTLHSDLSLESERSILQAITKAITDATGKSPRGWMGPALTETLNTPSLLPEFGMNYTLDWTNDDQPYWLNSIPVMSVPYSVELNDLGLFTMKGMSGPDFERMAIDHADQLLSDEPSGRVMARPFTRLL